jgi:UDP-N-acetylmuramoyl-tripeptide--D-alanyl-D-alanine ligase
MEPITVKQLCEITGAKQCSGDPQTLVSGVSIDSRRIRPGDVFVAFRGERVDGHAFVADALARGAAAAMVQEVPHPSPEAPIVKVGDPLDALQSLAHAERRRFRGPVVGITGSNGKTTTKQMVAAVFETAGPCLFTEGNYNNELGLPLTILRRTPSHQTMVLEMGMRGRGQIAALCRIAEPTAGVITNIGHSHLELLGSQEAIAEAKAELLQALPADGVAVLWYEDPWLQRMASRCRGRVLWYGGPGAPHAFAEDIRVTWEGTRFRARVLGDTVDVMLPVHGEHNVRNALAALLVGAVHGLRLADMAEGLRNVRPVEGRLIIRTGARHRRILDDCYNASPASVKESLHVLRQLASGRPTAAILGDMLELGTYERAGHEEVGRLVAEMGVQCLIAIGQRAEAIAEAARSAGCPHVFHWARVDAALDRLDDILPDGALVLVKASRAMQFERIVTALL